jgi:hypothetical protein
MLLNVDSQSAKVTNALPADGRLPATGPRRLGTLLSHRRADGEKRRPPMDMAHSSAAVLKHPDDGAPHDTAPSHDRSYAPFDHSHGEGALRRCAPVGCPRIDSTALGGLRRLATSGETESCGGPARFSCVREDQENRVVPDMRAVDFVVPHSTRVGRSKCPSAQRATETYEAARGACP